MSSIASFTIRRTASSVKSPQLNQLLRYLTVGKSVPIDVDHYSSGWDDKNGGSSFLMSPTGKYQIQTFNKISTHVRNK